MRRRNGQTDGRTDPLIEVLLSTEEFLNIELIHSFLGTKKHLYKWVCLSVRPSVRPSIAPSIRHSVGPLRRFIFGGIDVLLSTAWPVLALVP